MKAFSREVIKCVIAVSIAMGLFGSKEVVELVSKTPGAIGYSGMGFKTDGIKFVKVKKTAADQGYLPTLENFVTGKYSLGRSLHMYTLGQPTGHVKNYIEWIISPAGNGGTETLRLH
jgi:phosphate transport system substrate-binding protein